MSLPPNVDVKVPEPWGRNVRLQLKARDSPGKLIPESSILNPSLLNPERVVKYPAEDVIREPIPHIAPQPHDAAGIAEETACVVLLLGCIAEVG